MVNDRILVSLAWNDAFRDEKRSQFELITHFQK